ncbi:Tryprostatin B 6-hydroxylase [Ceratocystis fimbriata CBS 114723]|uniref:Tryprostatin B 6-hydroxylase n=1 Tax=Ceratocystis fimbriata CBS 114723 TaxID=1035309 RepID=A0A2C5X2S8_9PEZI|nr:Tryprostatin B 6-hydroxylase [Ceratocystis fimbriata CBS 114723]
MSSPAFLPSQPTPIATAKAHFLTNYIGGLVAAYLVYKLVVYPLWLSPLRKIPSAHPSARFSPLWIMAVRHGLLLREGGDSLVAQADLHRRLGPVVLVGPRHVSIDGPEIVRAVFYEPSHKARWYQEFTGYHRIPNILSSRDAYAHYSRRRIAAPVFTKSHLHNSAAFRAQAQTLLIDRLLPSLLKQAREPGGIETVDLSLAVVLDFITSYIFGIDKASDMISRASDVWSMSTKAGLVDEKKTAARVRFETWNLERCDSLAESSSTLTGKETHEKGNTSTVYQATVDGYEREIEENGEHSPLHEIATKKRRECIASETFGHIMAGHQPTAVVLSYVFWHLSRTPHIQKLLRDELGNLGIAGKSKLAPYKTLDACPVLTAVIYETCRLNSPIPGPQIRCTPRAGLTVEGYFIPGDVEVSACAYSLHRDEAVFKEAAAWKPERWLGISETRMDDLLESLWVFGSGPMSCIGSELALMILKYTIAAVYANFETAVIDDSRFKTTAWRSMINLDSSSRLTLSFERANTR